VTANVKPACYDHQPKQYFCPASPCPRTCSPESARQNFLTTPIVEAKEIGVQEITNMIGSKTTQNRATKLCQILGQNRSDAR